MGSPRRGPRDGGETGRLGHPRDGGWSRLSRAGIQPELLALARLRQATADNLGELRAKNGNQGFVSSLLRAGLGLAAHTALAATFGSAAPLLVAAAGGVGVPAP